MAEVFKLTDEVSAHRITVITFAAGMVCTLLLPLATGPLVLAGL